MYSKVKKVFWCVLIILGLCLISFLIYFLLNKFNITSIKTLRNFIKQFGSASWIVFVILEVLLSVPIFVIPFEDELWVTLAIVLFGAKVGCVLSVLAMILTSSVLYLFGRKFGVKLANKIIGEKAVENVQTKLNIKSKFSLPFLYLIPLFPHDILCVTSGISKMNFVYFFIVTLLLRSIEIVAICFFGGELINWASLSGFDWFVLINLLIIDIYLLSKLQKLMEKRAEKKTNDKDIKS